MTIGVAETNPSTPGRGEQSSKPSRKSSAKSISSKSNHDVRAMRHLRSIVESIAADENLSQAERYKKISNFEELLELAEKRMQDDQSVMSSNPVSKNVEQKKRRGWLKTRLLGKDRVVQDAVASPVRGGGGGGEQLPMKKMETVDEEVQESRGDVDVKRYDDITGQAFSVGREQAPANKSMDSKFAKVTRREPSPAGPLARDHGGDGTVDTCTDSIMGLRMQNSEDYVASVCSLRSLGTFERDFINNIIAEQVGNNDQISVSTFEKDFLARQANGENTMAHPTQVFIRGEFINPDAVADDLTVGTMLSETTFEQDARSITELPRVTPPTEVTAASGENDIFDDLSTGSNRSETKYDSHLRMRGSAPNTFATFTTMNNSDTLMNVKSVDSVSTYEKDMAALNTLAVKIGRAPSTKTTASDRSCSTFEKDAAMRADMLAMKKRVNQTHNAIRMNPSEQSTSTFEKDYQARSSTKQHSSLAAMSDAAAAAHNARWTNSFNRMGIQVTEAGTVLPKISPLAVELSPETIEKEVKLREREGTLWGRFACLTGW